MNVKVNKYVQVGLMVLIALLVFIWGYNFLKGRNILNPSNDYYLNYTEVSGIMESNPVLIRGLKVGQVTDINFDPTNSKYITIRIVIDKSVRIPKDSRALLASIDMLGSKGIILDVGTSPHFYNPSDTLRSEVQADMLSNLTKEMGPIKDQGQSILTNTDSIMMKVNATMDDETMANIKAVSENLKLMSEDMADLIKLNKAAITATVENLKLTMDVVAQERENITVLLENLKTFSDDLSKVELSKTMVSLDSSLQSLTALTNSLNSENGSLHMLMEDPALYNNLSAAAENASLLMENMRQYPSRYVHLSLFNKSQSTFMDEEGITKQLSENDNLSFLIVVKQSRTPLSIDRDNFANPNMVNEFQYKDDYYYHTGEYKLYQNVLDRIEIVKVTYPTAFIQVLKKGKPVPTEKVLK